MVYPQCSLDRPKSTCELFFVGFSQLGQCFVNVGLIFKVLFEKTCSIALQVKTIELCKELVDTATGLASLTSCRFHGVTSDKQEKETRPQRSACFNERSRKLNTRTHLGLGYFAQHSFYCQRMPLTFSVVPKVHPVIHSNNKTHTKVNAFTVCG